MRILVVEDEPLIQALAIDALTAAGYEAFGADNPVHALELLGAAEPIDVLLTDIRMPRGSGLDLARIVKRLWPKVSVVLTSGHVDPAELPVGESILRKPWSASNLVARIKETVA